MLHIHKGSSPAGPHPIHYRAARLLNRDDQICACSIEVSPGSPSDPPVTGRRTSAEHLLPRLATGCHRLPRLLLDRQTLEGANVDVLRNRSEDFLPRVTQPRADRVDEGESVDRGKDVLVKDVLLDLVE